jgi:target of EGR1 protein 1
MEQNEVQCNTIIRNIFNDVLNRKCPVVFHNGLLDLVFFYQSFYADIPPSLTVFIADVSEMFAGGLYDTKYVADFVSREKASFLAYLFRK